jgi:hypothetical protein
LRSDLILSRSEESFYMGFLSRRQFLAPTAAAGTLGAVPSLLLAADTVIYGNHFKICANEPYRSLVSDHSRRGQQACDIGILP